LGANDGIVSVAGIVIGVAGATSDRGPIFTAGLAGLVLQITAQQVVGPTRTSLLLMVEPVLAAVGGYVIGERLHASNLLGAVLILGGIALAEVSTLDRSVKEAG